MNNRWQIQDATVLALLVYMAVFVQSLGDADLIHPDTVFDLGGLAKAGFEIPGGKIVAPLLGIPFNVGFFYLLAPLVVLMLHWRLLRRGSVELLKETPVLDRLVQILPTLLLIAIFWKFAPYGKARPESSAAGGIIRAYHMTLVGVDVALLAWFQLPARAPFSGPSASARAFAHAFEVFSILAATTFAALATILAFEASPWFTDELGRRFETGLIFVCGLLVILATVMLLAVWSVNGKQLAKLNGDTDPKERLPLMFPVVVFLALSSSLALPHVLARPMNFSNADLYAKAPPEDIVPALIAVHPGSSSNTEGLDPNIVGDARRLAWRAYGKGVDLSGWSFDEARFNRASMPFIRLDAARVEGADFSGAMMVGASLIDTAMEGARFIAADLRDARILPRGPRLAQKDQPQTSGHQATNQSDSSICKDLEKARLYPRNEVPNCDSFRPPINLSGALLQGADLSGADLRCANLSQATMDSTTKLYGTDLRKADLTGANLEGVTLSKTNLRGAILNNATFKGGTLEAVNLQHTKLVGATFTDVNISPETDFRGADLQEAVFVSESEDGDEDTQGKEHEGKEIDPGPLFNFANLQDATLPSDFSGACLRCANIPGIKFNPAIPVNAKEIFAVDATQVRNASWDDVPVASDKCSTAYEEATGAIDGTQQ